MSPEPVQGSARICDDAAVGALGITLLVAFAAVMTNWRYRRHAFGTDLERDMNRRVTARPSSVFAVGLAAGAQAVRDLFRRNPDPALERMRLLAVGLQIAAWLLTALLVVGWFARR